MLSSSIQELSVLRPVTYAAVFDYPLTLRQLRESLDVVADEDAILNWWRTSPLLQATVEYRDGFFFPNGRGDLPVTRVRRETYSRELLERDRRVLSFVSRLPFVRMVALSGSLAHLNAEGAADLDLFVITSANRVWSVTVTMLAVARLLGWRKRLCMNYVISEQRMAIHPADLFSANQIIHLRPVFGHEVYRRFVQTNTFVADLYPNFQVSLQPSAFSLRPSWRTILEGVLSLGIAAAAERVARAVYGWHLKRRSATWQSRDQVRLEPECLKLHTSSHRAATLARYEAALSDALANASANTRNTKNTKNYESLISNVVAS